MNTHSLNTKNLYDNFSGVIELTSDDFEITENSVKVINKNFKEMYGFIKFYAPWCPHCTKLREMWSDLAIEFKNKFVIGAVNCENKKNYIIRNKLRILQYPTIKTVSNKGVVSNYEGDHIKDNMIFYICNKL
jgi:thioredoxin domain-containing protein 5